MIKADKESAPRRTDRKADRPVEFQKEDKSMMKVAGQPGGVPTQLIEEE